MIIKKLLGHKPLFFLAIVATGILTWASLAKIVSPIPVTMHGSDKVAHCIAYFVLTIVWFSFLFFSEKRDTAFKHNLLIAAVICVLYGGLMEVMQAVLTSYRSPDWYDIVANTSGTIFAVISIVLLKRKIEKIRLSSRDIR